MRREFALAVALAVAAGLAGCERKAQAPLAAASEAESPADDGYLASPVVTASGLQDGALALEGQAAPGARVRLAAPTGEALFADADAKGRWRIVAPTSEAPRIFGLSMTAQGRQVQSQGYVLADAKGAVTILRAGAGALRLNAGAAPRITAFDYDREGGAVISGVAPAEAVVRVRSDGAPLGEGRADSAGRFSVPITRPVSQGQHRFQIVGEGFDSAVVVDVTPAEPLDQGPFRSRGTASALRADWITPGGGVQTTVILN